MSSTLVAVTVTLSAADGAVNNPVAVIVPAEALQITEGLNAPVPETVAKNWTVAPSLAEDGPKTNTLVIVGGVGAGGVGAAAEIVIDCEPDFVVSSTLVAVTVTFPAEDGAVNSPVEVIDPVEVLQVTAELNAPVPATVAENWAMALPPTEDGPETDTLAIVGVGVGVGVVGAARLAPPHPMAVMQASKLIEANSLFLILLPRFRDRAPS